VVTVLGRLHFRSTCQRWCPRGILLACHRLSSQRRTFQRTRGAGHVIGLWPLQLGQAVGSLCRPCRVHYLRYFWVRGWSEKTSGLGVPKLTKFQIHQGNREVDLLVLVCQPPIWKRSYSHTLTVLAAESTWVMGWIGALEVRLVAALLIDARN